VAPPRSVPRGPLRMCLPCSTRTRFRYSSWSHVWNSVLCTIFNYLNSRSSKRLSTWLTRYSHLTFPFKTTSWFFETFQNRDGFIDKEDLHDMLASLGKNPTEEYLVCGPNLSPQIRWLNLICHILFSGWHDERCAR